MNYGLPYKGSKNKIAKDIIDRLPAGEAFVDLFCGAGGLSKGLEMSGLEGICGLDWFKEACMTYNRNFDHPFVNGDIKSPEIKEQFYETVKKQLNGRHLDIVAGGFPCQGFSMAGNRNRPDYNFMNDPRNILFKDFFKMIQYFEPDYFILENVAGLASMNKGAILKNIIELFEDKNNFNNGKYYLMTKRKEAVTPLFLPF